MERLVFIHQQSSNVNLQPSISFLKGLAERFSYLSSTPLYIVVDNSIDVHCFSDGIYYVPSGNEYREFSGWEAGLNYARNHCGVKDSAFIFSNETFITHRVFDLPLRNAFLTCFQSAILSNDAIICGDVDIIHSDPPYFFSSTFNRYVSTYLMCINTKGMEEVDTFLNPDELNLLFNNTPNLDSVLNKSLSFYKTDYAEYLEGHLYRFDIKNRYRWYGAQKLTIDNYKKLKLKLMSVIIEHYITQSLVAKDVVLIDVKQYLRRSLLQEAIFKLKKAFYSIEWRIKKRLPIFL